MGFFNKLISILTDEEIDTPLLPNDNNYSSNLDVNKLENSLTLKLINLRQRLTLIEQVLPDRVDKLKREIDNLETELSIATDETSIANIENKYLELEKQFDKLEPLCKEFLVRKELKILQKELDTVFFGQFDENRPLSSDVLSELENVFEALKAKQSTFHGESFNMFYADLLKAEYRLKCCKMLHTKMNSYDHYSSFENLLADIPKATYPIYGGFIKADYDRALETHANLVKQYEAENIEKIPTNLSFGEELINRLEPKLSKDFFADFVVDRVFKDNDFVRDFINLNSYLRDEKTHFSEHVKEIRDEQLHEEQRKEQDKIKATNQEKLEKEKAEEEEKEREFLKSATHKDLAKKLKQIDNSIFDVTQSYISIREYELKVAEARGLLSPINQLQVPDMETRRFSKKDIGIIIKKAQEQGVNFQIFCDIDDNTAVNCLLATVKEKANTLTSTPSLSTGSYTNFRKISGTYSPAFAKYFLHEIKDNSQIIFTDSNSAYYINDSTSCHNLGETQLLDVYQKVQNLAKSPQNVENVSVSLEMSYLKPIIPILEALDDAEITYYIPPIDSRTEKRSNTKKIYINRGDLETYKEKVHPKISTKELGTIAIGEENFNLTNEILADCDIPLISEKAKLKEQQQRYKTLTEQEMRQAIKQLDDDSYDFTDSYKDILTYEKQVAREKGVLSSKNEMATDDIDFIRIKHDDLWRLMQVAKEKGIRCSFLLDVDENTTKNVLVAFSKVKKDKLKLPNIIIGRHNPSNYIKFPGRYGNSLASFYNDQNYNDSEDGIIFSNNSFYCYSNYYNDILKSRIKKLYDTITALPTTDEDIEDIKVPLQLSYLRPLVPILEKLKEAKIEYYIPPFDDDTNKYEPTKKIYIDRKDLAVYKEKVHPQISNLENGVITIGYENITIPDIILAESTTPFEKSR